MLLLTLLYSGVPIVDREDRDWRSPSASYDPRLP